MDIGAAFAEKALIVKTKIVVAKNSVFFIVL